MTESEWLAFVMLAGILRTGKMGPSEKAWSSAVNEAIIGWSVLHQNRTGLSDAIITAMNIAAKNGELPEVPQKALDN